MFLSQVEKLPALIKPMQWKESQEEGRKLLNEISTDAQELRAILGPDYTTISTQLGVSAPTAQGSAEAGPSRTAGKTAANTGKKRHETEAADGSSEQAPPPKRKKKEPTKEPVDVIDLT